MLHGRLHSLRVKVKSRKEVGHLTKSGRSSYKVRSVNFQIKLVNLQSKFVNLQGTLVGHLKSVMLKDLVEFTL